MATLGLELDKTPALKMFEPKWLIIGAVVLIVAWLALVPLGFLFWQSFMTPASFDAPAEFTLGNYFEVYTSSETLRLFGNSTSYALGSSILALVIGFLTRLVALGLIIFMWVAMRKSHWGNGFFMAQGPGSGSGIEYCLVLLLMSLALLVGGGGVLSLDRWLAG